MGVKEKPGDGSQLRIRFYLTPTHPCGYLEGRAAATLLADPHAPLDPWLYDQLLRQGLRRNGRFVYRPYCAGCDQCQSVRIPVRDFRPNRSQRRIWRANQDLTVTLLPPVFTEELFALYERYLAGRHAGGPMDHPSRESFLDFLAADWMETRFALFRDGQGRLLAVAVVDLLPNGLSAVYTFYDPDASRQRSLGSFAILWQLELLRQAGGHWLYLGYYVAGTHKMRYKANFRPLEVCREQCWRPFHREP